MKTPIPTTIRPPARRRALIAFAGLGLVSLAVLGGRRAGAAGERPPLERTDAQWKAMLSPQAYDVLRHEGTERPFSSPLNDEKRAGTYHCAGCELPLFAHATKFDSGTGWPSFWQPLPKAIATSIDFETGVPRTEVHCARCGGHLGHVFNDGPKPTGKRYCMNGDALLFKAG